MEMAEEETATEASPKYLQEILIRVFPDKDIPMLKLEDGEQWKKRVGSRKLTLKILESLYL